jgi:hypothetical protein
VESIDEYGIFFRDAFALLHGGRAGEEASAAERLPGEPAEQYLARTRGAALNATRKRLIATEPPEALSEPHRLLLDLLANAVQADEALAEQVRAYQCGQFQESVAHSDRLQQLVVESQRMDRDLIVALHGLQASIREQLGLTAQNGPEE